MPKASINKIEIAEIALGDLLKTDLTASDKAALTAALTVVANLRPNVNAADHMPVFAVGTEDGRRVVGCSCGHTPKKAAALSSQTMSNFNTHLNREGVSRDYSPTGNQAPRFTDGPRKGMTWGEAYEAGVLNA